MFVQILIELMIDLPCFPSSWVLAGSIVNWGKYN